MKKKYLSLLFSVFLFNACIEDNGNYDYATLKDVNIGSLNSSYRFVLQQPVTLDPTVTTDIDASSLSYCWRIGADTLSRQKALSYTFTKALTSTDPLTFEIYDKTTGVRYLKRMTVSVVSPFQTGWLVLSNNSNVPTFSFLSYEEGQTYYSDLYKEVNKEALTGTPEMVKQLKYTDGSTGVDRDRISIICDNGKSVELDGTTMLRCKYYDDEYKGDGALHIGAISSEFYSTDYAIFIINGGKIYEKAPGAMGTPDDAYYQYPLNGDSKGYSVANHFTKGYSYGDFYLAVDELNHRYVSFNRSSLSAKVTSLTVSATGSTNDIDPDNLEGSSVWMGQAYNGNALSLLKTSAGEYILHIISGSWDGSWTLIAKYQFPDGVIDDESCFAPHQINPYLMFSKGNNLRALNLEALSSGANAVNDICSYDGPITSMYYAHYTNWNDDSRSVNEFGIAVQTSSSSGSLLLIDPSLTAKGQILKRQDNIAGKITSIWRKTM